MASVEKICDVEPRSGSRAKADARVHRKLREPRAPIAIPADPPLFSPVGLAVAALYRIAEFAFAASVLLLSMPFLVVIAVLIRWDTPGPVFFVQQRTGRSRRVRGRHIPESRNLVPPEGGFDPDRYYWVPTSIAFVKFRTMYRDAIERFPEYYWWRYDLDPDEVQEMYYKLEDDPRLTRVGRWLRMTSFDEIPNFWNVLNGDLHLVGPRPESVEIQGFYNEEQMLKFTVKPGLTCTSKIYGRGNLPVGEQIAWDLRYVHERSLWLDLKVVFLTIWRVLTQRGAF
jgi:lipopolysaccharide/colanic/teichoic acid biosynthesis glycosyltransferase